MEEKNILECAFSVIIILLEKKKNQKNFPLEWKGKIRENIIWCLNILYELVREAHPIENATAEEKKEHKMKEYNVKLLINFRIYTVIVLL